ncbi:MAG: hypothetical protein R2854_28425 [Caldilineaceae bacterium]
MLRLDYTTHLWLERSKSVANNGARDVGEFLDGRGGGIAPAVQDTRWLMPTRPWRT